MCGDCSPIWQELLLLSIPLLLRKPRGMLRRLSWRSEPLKGLISISREHVPLFYIVHEEDPGQHLDHLVKVEVKEMLAQANKGDEAM